MSDNVAITAAGGATHVVACDELNHPTLGLVKVQYVKLLDATPDGSAGAFVNANDGLRVHLSFGGTLITQTGGAIDVNIKSDAAAVAYTPHKKISAASTNATSLKGSAGTIGMITVSNINASPRYLKLYNKASAPTVGTDTPVLVFLIPGNAAGAGSNIPIPDVGIAFTLGIAYALTTGVADSDTGAVAANEIVVNIAYQ
jgi:hypothetical protein